MKIKNTLVSNCRAVVALNPSIIAASICSKACSNEPLYYLYDMFSIYRAVWILPTEYTWPRDNVIAHSTYMAQVKLHFGIELTK